MYIVLLHCLVRLLCATGAGRQKKMKNTIPIRSLMRIIT